MLRRIAIIAIFLLAEVVAVDAMTFSWRDNSTVYASGPIEEGDAAQFEALRTFRTLELDSPGGLVGEALRIAKNMDVRGSIGTVVNRAVVRFRMRDGAVRFRQNENRLLGWSARHPLLRLSGWRSSLRMQPGHGR